MANRNGGAPAGMHTHTRAAGSTEVADSRQAGQAVAVLLQGRSKSRCPFIPPSLPLSLLPSLHPFRLSFDPTLSVHGFSFADWAPFLLQRGARWPGAQAVLAPRCRRLRVKNEKLIHVALIRLLTNACLLPQVHTKSSRRPHLNQLCSLKVLHGFSTRSLRVICYFARTNACPCPKTKTMQDALTRRSDSESVPASHPSTARGQSE